MSTVPVVILDWDYETFGFDIDDDEVIVLYKEIVGDLVYLEGWPRLGQTLPRTLYKRIAGTNSFRPVSEAK